MLGIIGYYLGAWLFTYIVVLICTTKKANSLKGKELEEYKRSRLISVFLIALVVAIVVGGLSAAMRSAV